MLFVKTMATQTDKNDEGTNSSSAAPIKQPPKKKRKRGNFWLVKVPVWVAEQWFDDTKYPNGSRLGELYVSPDAADPNKKSMKLELTQPLKRSKTNNNHNYNNYSMADDSSFNKTVDQFKDIPIPPVFKMEQRESRNRVNVKHGSLKVLGKDQLLVFHDVISFIFLHSSITHIFPNILHTETSIPHRVSR